MHEIIQKVRAAPDIFRQFEHKLQSGSDGNYPDLVSFVNPYSYMVLRSDLESSRKVSYYYSDALVSSLLFTVLLGRRVPRVSFDLGSFALYFMERLNVVREPVFFIGSKEETIAKSVDMFRRRYPGLKVSGYRHGYFADASEQHHIARDIVASGAKFVVCGMGTPHQERFGAILREEGRGTIRQIYTCGGFLHQSARRLDYYPYWINKLGLRWLYRAFDESYVVKRLLNHYPRFVYRVILDRFSGA